MSRHNSRLDVHIDEVKVTPRSGGNFMLPPQPTRKPPPRKVETIDYFNGGAGGTAGIMEVHSMNK